jgi:hypothetical protein
MLACNTPDGIKNRMNAHQSQQCRMKCRKAQTHRMRPCYGISPKGNTPVFECMTDAARWLNKDKTITAINKIKECLNGNRKSAYGYVWKGVMPNEVDTKF